MASETLPDVVLMDMRLKGPMDGVDTALRMRNGRRPAIIFLTAYADPETVHRARLVEPEGYLLKPVNERELAANIEIALFRHRSVVERHRL
jgi:DNA-binding response OmpR family regulator